jgi:hypothetical protein
MTTAIECDTGGGVAAAGRGVVSAPESARGRSTAAGPGPAGESPAIRYLYDEDGRILAEAVAVPKGD